MKIHLKHTVKPSWALGVVALVALSAADLSSYCHPSEASTAVQTSVRRAAEFRGEMAVPASAISTSESNRGGRELSWKELEDVDFKDVYLEELDAYYWKPTFGDGVRALETKELYITGYVIPVDIDEDFYVLSRYPYANCFFCGGAGPESVVDLRFADADHRAYATDERLTFAGSFRLNADDIYQMNYILDDVVEFTPPTD
jgi:hypothetical protein